VNLPPTAESEELKEGLLRSRDSHLLSDIAAFGVGAGVAHGPGGAAPVVAAAHLGSGGSEMLTGFSFTQTRTACACLPQTNEGRRVAYCLERAAGHFERHSTRALARLS
jgi:hypothetical protein